VHIVERGTALEPVQEDGDFVKSRYEFRVLLLPLAAFLASCGGGDGGGGSAGIGRGGTVDWQPGVFLPDATFADRCVTPRPGTDDRAGTATDENNWLRSWTNDTYLWYREVPDRDPGLYSTINYFNLLKTTATTSSGQAKDKFHFTYDTDDWIALSQSGISAGYGAAFEILSPQPPRRIVVAYVQEGSNAFGELQRGDEVLLVDGNDVVNGGTSAIVSALNAGLFPDDVNETHTFRVRGVDGIARDVSLVSQEVAYDPVPVVDVFETSSGDVGYLLFNDHVGTAESALETAVSTLRQGNVTDLILDLRYNGGGYLDIASEAAYMVANPTLTSGRTFEKLVFNDKHPNTDPVSGRTITPTPFHSTSQGFSGAAGRPLPNLALGRVYVITGPGTCSASESIINALRGVNVQVYLIGSTTCGKPYGFYPTDNCGTTYFSIQFRGENNANFGDYSDGFSPANTAANAGVSVPGCSVADDFTRELGDPAERRVAAALSFRASNNQVCPAASGFSDPRLSKASFQNAVDRHLWVSKPAARMNRIISRGS
jgi:carboxyl-terminal processing protease